MRKASKMSIMSRKSEQPDYITELYLLEQTRKNLSKWTKLKLAIYDPEKGEIFGKDSLRWGK